MKNNSRKRGAAVVIPLYKSFLTDSEIFSLHNTANVLGGHDIFIIGPKKLEDALSRLIMASGFAFRLRLFSDKFFNSIAGYNQLLMSGFFYQSFSDYKYILIAQTDALVFSDELNKWCATNYSYIGAPWFNGFAQPLKPLEFLGIGNGGFSLRNITDFLKVLKYPKRINNNIQKNYRGSKPIKLLKFIVDNCFFSYSFRPFMPRINEDIFWGLLVPENFSFFTVPTFHESISFAFEVEPRFLYELNQHRLPFGCHAWEKYDLKFWEQVLPEHGIKLQQ